MAKNGEEVLRPIEKMDISALLLMVSGGSDSVALCRLVCDLCEEGGLDKDQVIVFHVNHCIRGDESDGDEVFTKELAQECGFAFESRSVNIPVLLRRGGGNLEDVARAERYHQAEKVLKNFCRRKGYDLDDARICTAHTLDDRIETFVMRSIIGVGPGGLGSIPRTNGRVFRPLLDLTRNHCRAYLLRKAGYPEAEIPQLLDRGQELGLWREDSSNADTDHFRAYVRHEIIPRMRRCNPGLDDNLRRTMDLVVDESDFLDEYMADILANKIERDKDDTLVVDVDALFSLAVPVRRRAVHALCAQVLPDDQRIEAQHIERIVSEGDKPRFGISLPGNISVRNEYGKLIFMQPHVSKAVRTAKTAEFDFDLAFYGTVVLPSGRTISAYHVEDFGGDPEDFARRNATRYRVYVDGDRIAQLTIGQQVAATTVDPAGRGDNPFVNLHVTNLREGDTFCPLGMGGAHKKVTGLMSDEKMPRRQRIRTAIVRAGDEIVWVCGLRIDDRFRVGPETRYILCLEMNESEE